MKTPLRLTICSKPVTNESQHSNPTPFASSMNVSGLNIDVGNPTAQNSHTWSISNISVTLIPSNLTNTKMHVSEGAGSTLKISSKANTQSKSPREFLLNPG
ncbi:hypothetical protein O181_032093 [Austropuccinia psidii MF-1]|uniref:Uncharacterized protein n=1 Tax=Austropuccinia psidii MF-1 TaxID=1389203 RepID=A0A9Q3CYS7_9BASI|nr:hypothetical protein [Austropuccinia psidii MF-1]